MKVEPEARNRKFDTIIVIITGIWFILIRPDLSFMYMGIIFIIMGMVYLLSPAKYRIYHNKYILLFKFFFLTITGIIFIIIDKEETYFYEWGIFFILLAIITSLFDIYYYLRQK